MAIADARIQNINATNDDESNNLIITLSNAGSMSQIMGWPSRKSDQVENLNLCAIEVIVTNQNSIYTLVNLNLAP